MADLEFTVGLNLQEINSRLKELETRATGAAKNSFGHLDRQAGQMVRTFLGLGAAVGFISRSLQDAAAHSDRFRSAFALAKESIASFTYRPVGNFLGELLVRAGDELTGNKFSGRAGEDRRRSNRTGVLESVAARRALEGDPLDTAVANEFVTRDRVQNQLRALRLTGVNTAMLQFAETQRQGAAKEAMAKGESDRYWKETVEPGLARIKEREQARRTFKAQASRDEVGLMELQPGPGAERLARIASVGLEFDERIDEVRRNTTLDDREQAAMIADLRSRRERTMNATALQLLDRSSSQRAIRGTVSGGASTGILNQTFGGSGVFIPSESTRNIGRTAEAAARAADLVAEGNRTLDRIEKNTANLVNGWQ